MMQPPPDDSGTRRRRYAGPLAVTPGNEVVTGGTVCADRGAGPQDRGDRPRTFVTKLAGYLSRAFSRGPITDLVNPLQITRAFSIATSGSSCSSDSDDFATSFEVLEEFSG